MPRHTAWHCITQQAALCCFISSIAAVFCHLGATGALESLQSMVNQRACIDESKARSNDDTWRCATLVDWHGDWQYWWMLHSTVIRDMAW